MRPPTLIPRPETEYWVHSLAKEMQAIPASASKPLQILEIGSGSGCIALALAALLPRRSCNILSLDIAPEAVKLALENQQRNTSLLQNDVHFAKHDILQSEATDSFPRRFDLIVSNPPYIPPTEYTALDASVVKWESRLALVGKENDDGLEYYRKIARLCDVRLAKSSTSSAIIPSLVVEIGHLQAEAVQQIFDHLGHVKVEQDQFGKPRVVKLYRS